MTVKLSNTSPTYAGKEVVQLYVVPPSTTRLSRPPKELKAFSKVFLGSGGSKTVSLTLDKVSLSYWDDRENCWVAEKGMYGVMVGTGDGKWERGDFALEQEFTWTGL